MEMTIFHALMIVAGLLFLVLALSIALAIARTLARLFDSETALLNQIGKSLGLNREGRTNEQYRSLIHTAIKNARKGPCVDCAEKRKVRKKKHGTH